MVVLHSCKKSHQFFLSLVTQVREPSLLTRLLLSHITVRGAAALRTRILDMIEHDGKDAQSLTKDDGSYLMRSKG